MQERDIDYLINFNHQTKRKLEEKIMMKEIYDIQELSSYLKVSVSEIRKLVREKRIPFFRVGNRLRFDLKKVNSWIEELQENEQKYSLFC